jgi:hypothetical protein
MFIAHRINTIEELKKVPIDMGVEVDLRDLNGDIILSHDPFVYTSSGIEFEEYLKHYKHSFIILNIKSERIEYRVLELLKEYNINDYFFLDSSFPMMYKLSTEGENNIAIRYSEFESIYTVINNANKFKWVWVDCFTKLPLNNYIFQLMKIWNFKICLVSPDLQGQQDKVEEYSNYLLEKNIIPDMVCSKIYNYDLWKKII